MAALNALSAFSREREHLLTALRDRRRCFDAMFATADAIMWTDAAAAAAVAEMADAATATTPARLAKFSLAEAAPTELDAVAALLAAGTARARTQHASPREAAGFRTPSSSVAALQKPAGPLDNDPFSDGARPHWCMYGEPIDATSERRSGGTERAAASAAGDGAEGGSEPGLASATETEDRSSMSEEEDLEMRDVGRYASSVVGSVSRSSLCRASAERGVLARGAKKYVQALHASRPCYSHRDERKGAAATQYSSPSRPRATSPRALSITSHDPRHHWP